MADTIFALSSGHGRVAVAVIRISGAEVATIIDNLCGQKLAPRKATLVWLHDNDLIIDQSLAIHFPAGNSFTGEDMLELHVHGSLAVINKLTDHLARMVDVRPAMAGEFARRAFANGRLNLVEVEGISDLLAAETELQRQQAIKNIDGGLSSKCREYMTGLVDCLAYFEAMIDFSDDEVPVNMASPTLRQLTLIKQEISALLATGSDGEILRNGIEIVLLGPPNSGKSSIINAIAGRDVAIVSATPGTTRDIIEVRLDLDGCLVTICDTAGVRDSGDAIEKCGMERAVAKADAADLVLWTVAPDAYQQPATSLKNDVWVVCNKIDSGDDDCLSGKYKADIGISAKTGYNLDELLAKIKGFATSKVGDISVITRARHKSCLQRCHDCVARALAGSIEEPECIAEEIRLAIRSLEMILGKVDVEDVLARIFAGFCIGK